MKSLKYLIFLLLILVIGFSIYVAVQPNSFEVTRTRTIKAPAAVIYDNVIDFKNWEAWSSWVESDSDMKIMLSDHTKGVNGHYSWEDKDGIGTMVTLAATAHDSIIQQMQFSDFPSSDVSWNFNSNDNGSTDVTWNISGKDLPFVLKAFSAVMGGMEKQIGPHYERSLEKLDSIVVNSMKVYTIKVEGITEHGGGFYLYNTTSCKIDDFKKIMRTMLPKVGDYAIRNKIGMAGNPFIYYHKWDIPNNSVMFSCCIPITSKVITNESDILTGQFLPFKAVKTTLYGDYTNLKEAWDTTMRYIAEHNLEYTDSNAPMLETFLTDPVQTPNPADWITEIYIAVN